MATMSQEIRAQATRRLIPAQERTVLEMFDFILEQLGDGFDWNCDGTSHFAREFLRIRSLNEDEILRALESLGGDCDCNIVLNVGPWFWPSQFN